MRSFGADPAEFRATGIHPALTSLADEIVGTMARPIPYVVALALLAIIGISLLDQLPDIATRALSQGRLEQGSLLGTGVRRHPHLIHKTKQSFMRYSGDRKGVFLWTDPDKAGRRA